MNYIQEELQRQARAFAALLGIEDRERDEEQKPRTAAGDAEGRGPLRAAPTAAETAVSGTEQALWNQLLRRSGNANRSRAAAALGLCPHDGGELTTTEERGAERIPALRYRADVQNSRENGEQTGNRPGEYSAPAGGGRWEDAIMKKAGYGAADDAETAAPRSGRYGAAYAADTEPAAAELSRAFQRDARRYDGGYPLY